MTRLQAAAMAALCAAAPALAQEMLSMPAATAPSPGVLIPRIQGRAYFYDDGQTLLEEAIRLEFGLARDLSLSAELPLFQGFLDEPLPSDGEFGLGDLDLLVEWRFLREDLGPVDTVRASVFGGAVLPTGTGSYGGDGVDPCIGAAWTGIFGRHGLDFAARYTLVADGTLFEPLFAADDGDDLVDLDAGYAYRIHPDSYGEERAAAWYATLEVNALLTTGGRHEVLLSPGLLLEAPDYAVEIGVQLPLSVDSGDRPELEFALILGLRLLF